MRARAATAAVVSLVALVLAAGVQAWLSRLPPRLVLPALDAFYLFWPAHTRLGRELAEGRLPLWNPLLGFGINEAADINLGFLYPPNALFAVLPLGQATALLKIAHVALAAVGTFFLCRRTSLGLAAAAVGAITLIAGNDLQHVAHWPTTLNTVAWFPLACLAARGLRDRPGTLRVLVLASVLACQLFAGYLQLHLYTVLCLPLFFLPADRPSVFLRPLVLAAVAEIVALGLAAVAVVPAMVAIADSWRGQGEVPEMLHHLLPIHPWDYVEGLAAPALPPRAPIYGGPVFPVLVLAGVMARGVAPHLRVPALLFTGIAIVLSLGDATPIFPLLRRLPISHWFTGPYKWTYLAPLGAALLGAVGAEALLRDPHPRRLAARTWAALGLGLVVLVPASLASRAMMLVSVILLFLVHRHGGRAIAAVVLPAVLGVSALAAYEQRGSTPDDLPQFYGRYQEAYAFLAGRQEEGRTYFSVGPNISPRQGELEAVAQVNTNGVTVPVRLARYFEAVGGAVRGDDARSAAALLRALGARFVVTRPAPDAWPRSVGALRVASSRAADVWEDAAALPRAYLARRVEHMSKDQVLARLSDPAVADDWTAVLEDEEGPGGVPGTGVARIVRSSDTGIVVQVDAVTPGVLVLLDSWSTEWRAWVDGRPAHIRRANWLARAVEVPAGRVEVVFRFVPMLFYVALATSVLTIVGCLVTAVVLRRRPPRAS